MQEYFADDVPSSSREQSIVKFHDLPEMRQMQIHYIYTSKSGMEAVQMVK